MMNPMFIESETNLWPGLFVCRSVGRTVGLSVIISCQCRKLQFYAPIKVLVLNNNNLIGSNGCNDCIIVGYSCTNLNINDIILVFWN